MFESLLIANRGEIACRVIRTARRLGIRTIAVYSQADAGALHVELADEAWLLGPAPARQSYLDIAKIIHLARAAGARALHPGYGFLSENADFAEACASAGIVFVGPGPAAIRVMGSKIEAKRLVRAAGTPVVPGYEDDDQDLTTLTNAAAEVGFPLLIKASAGGGGKGMRLVEDAAGFARALEGARREAAAAFGDDRVLLERYLRAPKHIEVQVLGDTHGNLVHLFERDCSVQRRHQKVVEEAPGPTVSPAWRERLGEAALKAARAIDYVGAGTVEFIAQPHAFYFMEMNTRLQVEHPVTEAITGLDLVELQLAVAAGERLNLEPVMRGHAIEVRLYAENPGRGFLPSTGTLVRFRMPTDIRVDSGVREGDVVGVHYDPMLAKLIAHAPTREEARRALGDALARAQVAGVEHNLGYLRALLAHPEFVRGEYSTHLAEDAHGELVTAPQEALWGAAALVVRHGVSGAGTGPWWNSDGWRLNLPAETHVHLRRGKERRTIRIGAGEIAIGDGASPQPFVIHRLEAERGLLAIGTRQFELGFAFEGSRLYLMHEGNTLSYEVLTDTPDADTAELAAPARVEAPMPGQVVSVAVATGEQVARGQVLVVIEAMKMEHSVTAPYAGVVKEVLCRPGQRVEEHVELVVIEAPPRGDAPGT